jgi:hypothetical protein
MYVLDLPETYYSKPGDSEYKDVYPITAEAKCIFNFLLFFSFFTIFLGSILKKDIPLIGGLLTGVYSFSFYAFLTHNISRYNVPLIPITWVCAIIIFYKIGIFLTIDKQAT